jgi:hypothetical protein
MEKHVELRQFNFKTNLREQRDLFIESFPENIGTNIITEEYYYWKFQRFPQKPPSYEYEALLDGEQIGYYAALPYSYTVSGKVVKCGMVCDVMTGIKARGRGVFTKLGVYATNRLKEEGLSFITGFPIRDEVIPGHRKAGWNFPFKIPMYGKFIQTGGFCESRGYKILAPFIKIASIVVRSLSHLFRIVSGKFSVEISDFSEFRNLDQLTAFFKVWEREIPIALSKNLDFLRWRLNAPGKKYLILTAAVNGKVVAYSIVREVLKENVRCYGIVDLCTLKGFEHAATSLMGAIEENASESGIELILIMMLKDRARQMKFFRNGYIRTPYSFSFIIKKFDPGIQDEVAFSEKNWHLTWIDSDDL